MSLIVMTAVQKCAYEQMLECGEIDWELCYFEGKNINLLNIHVDPMHDSFAIAYYPDGNVVLNSHNNAMIWLSTFREKTNFAVCYSKNIICTHMKSNDPTNVGVYQIWSDARGLKYVKIPALNVGMIKIMTLNSVLRHDSRNELILDMNHFYSNGPLHIAIKFNTTRLAVVIFNIGEIYY